MGLLLQLLKVYLNPTQGKVSKQDEALQLLDRSGMMLDPIGVFELLPPTLPLKTISTFLDQAIPQHNRAVATAKLNPNMQMAYNFAVSVDMTKLKNRKIVVDAKRTCE